MLTTSQLASAQSANPRLFPSLGMAIPMDWPHNLNSPEFAEYSARLQKRVGLCVDGKFGKDTAAAYKAHMSAPRPDNYLIIGGERHAVDFKVVNYEQDPRWSLYRVEEVAGKAYDRGYRRRNTPVDLFVIHWDVANSSKDCRKILLAKDVSVHLMLDSDGTVYQALDLLDIQAWHAGSTGKANKRSVGVEMCNPWSINRKSTRPIIKSPGVNGNPPHEHLDFHPVQKEVCVKLVKTICDIMGIPKQLPRVPAWESETHKDDNDPDGSIARGELVDPLSFTGVLGHFHVESKKIDPDVELFDHFTREGFE